MASSDPIVSTAEQIDALCDDFEAAWRAGERPRLEDYLNRLPAEPRDAALAQLLRVEVELRRRGGDAVDASSFHQRFPHSEPLIQAVFSEAQSVVDTSVSQTPATIAGDELLSSPLSAEELPAALGRFEVLGKIGAGAFGVVLKARDPQLDRIVAIKLPRRGTLSRPDDLERFLREAKTAATMHHPNICPVYEVGTADGRPYIVMALVPGKSVADHIKQSKQPLSIRQAVLVVRKLALALELAHAKGIIHRDLKPANILLDRERNDVVIMDFGMARFERHNEIGLTVSGMVMGTPAYMSPEQARGDQRSIGPATDIYSLGVILHELLTRQRPFEGSIAEVLGKILHVEAPGPAAARPEVDEQLDGIVRKCMAKSPAERFGSMKQLADALTGYLKERASSASSGLKASSADENASTPSSSGPTTDDILAAFSSDLKQQAEQHRSDTQAAIETAVQRAKIPLWQWFAAAGLFALVIACGIIFFARTPTASVLINIDVDLKDPELRFVLDNIAIPAANLAEPMELKVGRHELIVYRGETTERRFVFDVKGGATPAIAIKEDTGPPDPPDLPGLVVKPGEWTPLLEVENPHEMWRLGKRASDALRFSPGRVEIQGFGMTTSRVKANNYVLRARLKVVGDGMVSLGGNGVPGKGSNQVSWRAEERLVLNKVRFAGNNWHSFGAARLTPDAEGFVDAALGLHNGRLMMYSGDKLLLEVEDDEYRGSATTISHWNSKGKDQGSAEVRDLQIFVLDGTTLTPEDALKQRSEKLVVRPGEWTPLLVSDDPLKTWNVISEHANRRVLPSAGRLQFKGFANLSPKIIAKEYVVRARIKPTAEGKITLAGNAVERKGSNHIHLDPNGRVYLAKSTFKGTDFKVLGDARTAFDADGFADLALAFYQGKIQVYSGSRRLIESDDSEYRGGRTHVMFFNPKGWDQGDGEIRDLQMFILDGTKFTPEGALKLLAIDDAQDDGFESIFDGKTLEGWDGNPDFWSVKDGAITGTTTAAKPTRRNTYIIWRKGETADFELKFDYKIVGGNSGAQYRSFEVPNEKWGVGGYQADLDAGETYAGINYGERFRGLLANRGQKSEVIRTADGKVEVKVIENLAESADLQKAIKKEDWNSCHIIAKGFEFTHIINGKTMSICIDKDEKERRASGILALQLHAGPPMQVQFKNLRLKKLAGKNASDPDRTAAR